MIALLLALALAVGAPLTAPRSAPDEWNGGALFGANPLGETRLSGQGRSGAPSERSGLVLSELSGAPGARDGYGSTPFRKPVIGAPHTAIGTALFGGVRMTWYCRPGKSRCTHGYPASFPAVAVSPDLGIPRGTRIRICRAGVCTHALVVDCDCRAHYAIDAYASVFARLAPLSAGSAVVTVEAVGRGLSAVPPTDTR